VRNRFTDSSQLKFPFDALRIQPNAGDSGRITGSGVAKTARLGDVRNRGFLSEGGGFSTRDCGCPRRNPAKPSQIEKGTETGHASPGLCPFLAPPPSRSWSL